MAGDPVAANSFKNDIGAGQNLTSIGSGGVAFYSFTTVANSATITVLSNLADFSFDKDTGGSAGDAVVVIRKIVGTSSTENASYLLPNQTNFSGGTDSYTVKRGRYYIDVTTGRSGGETPVVRIEGREG